MVAGNNQCYSKKNHERCLRESIAYSCTVVIISTTISETSSFFLRGEGAPRRSGLWAVLLDALFEPSLDTGESNGLDTGFLSATPSAGELNGKGVFGPCLGKIRYVEASRLGGLFPLNSLDSCLDVLCQSTVWPLL